MHTKNDSLKPMLCRDCGQISAFGPVCPHCGGHRTIQHDEIESLAIAHVDCDAFFASIEKRDEPSLATKPVIVGGGTRGVVATCCYIARTYGVRSAMPIFKAKALCPQAVIRPPRFEAYQEAAHLIREEMLAITPLVQPLSIDEAFLDLTGTERLHKAVPASSLARLARQIEERVGITVSIGLSHNKFLAKLASDLDKPRGFAVIGEAETMDFLAPLPPTAIYGVGKSFGDKLARDGITRLQQLQSADPRELMRQYGEHGLRLYRLSRGEDDRRVSTEREIKSVSGETTFNEDIHHRDLLEDKLYAMAQKVSRRAKAKGLAGRVVTLKLKTSSFRSFTRRKTLPHPTNLAQVILETGQHLLRAEEPQASPTHEAYRLIGIGISDLCPAVMMDADFLFPEAHRRIGRQEDAIDKLRQKFGDDVIGTGRDKRAPRPKPKE